MYVWIWRHLPGHIAIRALTALLLILAVSALLLFVVFPAISPYVELWSPRM